MLRGKAQAFKDKLQYQTICFHHKQIPLVGQIRAKTRMRNLIKQWIPFTSPTEAYLTQVTPLLTICFLSNLDISFLISLVKNIT